MSRHRNETFLYLDTETVGLVGPTKLIQYSIDDGPVVFIKLFRGWENDTGTRAKVSELIDLIDRPDTVFVAFNASFDTFRLYRLKHRLLGYEYDSEERPVMPFACKVLDLQVHAMQKSILAPFAFNRGNRSVAIVRRIPKDAMSYVSKLVLDKLKSIVPKTFEISITVHQHKKQPHLVSLAFKLKGRVSLKGLMKEYGIPTIELADVWPLPEKGSEKPWLPYPDPAVHDPIEQHCDYIMRSPDSRFFKYSKLDILYLKVLEEKLGHPQPDYNSACCHNMAYLRYYGFDLDREHLIKARKHYADKVSHIEKQIEGTNLRSSKERLELLQPYFPLIASTNKATLKVLANGEGKGAELCQAIVGYGPARQRMLQIDKVLECRTGRAHIDLRVMGTATDRMAGTSGLNWQGIGEADEVEIVEDEHNAEPEEFFEMLQALDEEPKKEKIGLRHAVLTPCVGDWKSFEVRIAAAVYNDKQLQEDIKEGLDLHSRCAIDYHPAIRDLHLDYDQFVKEQEHTPLWHKARKNTKSGIFGSFYFCTAHSVSASWGVLEHEAQSFLDGIYERYPGMLRYRQEIEQRFLTADTERWTKDSVRKMERSLKSLMGFERRWDFEAAVATAMWELGHTRIKTGLAGTVVRSVQKGLQTKDNAVKSALLGSAIAIQAAVSRQAGNMKIQSTGATINKVLQAEVWERFRLPSLNVHDENVIPHHPNFNYEEYEKFVREYEQRLASVVPMLEFEMKPTERWSDK